MNKLTITTAITLASIAFVGAQGTTTVKRPVQVRPQEVRNMIKNEGRDIQMPNLRTGDPAIDAQLKTLNDEMEAKIKSIRDEYVAKIKAIVGDRASTTGRMMPGRREGMDEGRKLGIPFIGDASSTASGTPQRPLMMRIQNEGENNQGDQNAPKQIPAGVMNFFRGLFGGNR